MLASGPMMVYLTTLPGGDPSFWALVADADVIVQGVLLGLVGMSVVCWSIILRKSIQLRAATRQSEAFVDRFWAVRRVEDVLDSLGEFPSSPVAQVFRAGHKELARIGKADKAPGDAIDNVTRALRRTAVAQSARLERHLTFLATTGATSPFIGLFGTVWGILRAFQKLGSGGAATIDVVGPDIAHALIATAVGLAAAIPAVIAYNYFNASLRHLTTEMDTFSADFLNIVKRQLL